MTPCSCRWQTTGCGLAHLPWRIHVNLRGACPLIGPACLLMTMACAQHHRAAVFGILDSSAHRKTPSRQQLLETEACLLTAALAHQKYFIGARNLNPTLRTQLYAVKFTGLCCDGTQGPLDCKLAQPAAMCSGEHTHTPEASQHHRHWCTLHRNFRAHDHRS